MRLTSAAGLFDWATAVMFNLISALPQRVPAYCLHVVIRLKRFLAGLGRLGSTSQLTVVNNSSLYRALFVASAALA